MLLRLLASFLMVLSQLTFRDFSNIAVFADDDPCQQSSYDSGKCQDQIKNLQKSLDDARGQEKTLKSQLDFIDTQTKITELKIADTNYQIKKLDQEINDLSGRITRVSSSVDSISAILLDRIVRSYKYSDISTLDLIFASRGFADLLERIKYIEVAQAHDKKVLYELQATKAAYNDQKNDKETRQAQQEKLKKDLDTYQKQLVQDKAAKETLLKVTQNNEAIYQSKLQAALAEQQAILQILKGGGNEVSDGAVSKGQVIGNFINGRSACSSGSHVHFEVHKNSQIVNPSEYLSNHSVTWDNSPDGQFSFSGSWDWPVNDPVYIEQGFGMTYWAKSGWYGGGPHTGIDIYSPSDTPIRAVHDGKLSHGGIHCGSGTLLYKKVDHSDGIISYYLHVI